MMGVAALVTPGRGARLAFCSAGGTPVLVEVTNLDEAQVQVQARLDPPGNVHASKAYKRHLASVLAGRALKVALERAG
jgi:carbon-monoxide dehydrogenase medium subunit